MLCRINMIYIGVALICTMLVFVFFVLAIISPLIIAFGSGFWTSSVSVSLVYLAMSFVSYTAAVASARGYGTSLRAIAENDRETGKARYRILDFIKRS